jgi:excisionase family DNA binding protein
MVSFMSPSALSDIASFSYDYEGKESAMTLATTRDNDPVIPAATEATALDTLARLLAANPDAALELRPVRPDEQSGGDATVLPPAAAAVLRRAVAHLARGRAVMPVGLPTLLTTQQAADLLGVSRPYLVTQLLETGLIPFTRTGSQRRVALDDVLAYRQRRDDEQYAALVAMTQEAEALGLYERELATRANGEQ